jgi:hypothetical protein
MDLHLRWVKPLPLSDGKRDGLIYTADIDDVPETGGVYVFGRAYGSNFEALYVGKSDNVRGRIYHQLNNVRLMQHLKQARSGARYLLAGVFEARPGQQEDRSLRIIERALIRHFLSEGHDLVNKQGARLRQHSVKSRNRPNWFVPKCMFVDS